VRTTMRVLAWLCALLAAAGIVGGAYLYGVNAGLFVPGRADDVGSRLLDDRVFQRVLAERTADAIVEQVPALEPRREALVESAVNVTETHAYRVLFQGVVDIAYERALDDELDEPVVITADDLAGLLARREPAIGDLPLGPLRAEGVELMSARDIAKLRTAKSTADRWAIPLLAGGVALAAFALALPGRKGPRLVVLGACVTLGAAVLYFANGIAGDEIAARSPQDGRAVVDALWASAAGSIRVWLGGTFMAGLLIVATGFVIGVGRDRPA
jgi:hypothetical protein